MAEETNVRWERIVRLLHEIEYEVIRGMLEEEIDETVLFQFFVPLSRAIPDGVVMCEFRTRPVIREAMLCADPEKARRLRVVK